MTSISTFVRRHTRAAVVSGAAVVALAGGGIAYAATASGSASTPAPAVSAPTTTPASTGAKVSKKHHGVRATVTAISGDTWTVKTAGGKTLTVTIDAQTAFGTKADPSQASAFPVGSTVAVAGHRSGMTITATRIATPKVKGTGTSTPASASPVTS